MKSGDSSNFILYMYEMFKPFLFKGEQNANSKWCSISEEGGVSEG